MQVRGVFAPVLVTNATTAGVAKRGTAQGDIALELQHIERAAVHWWYRLALFAAASYSGPTANRRKRTRQCWSCLASAATESTRCINVIRESKDVAQQLEQRQHREVIASHWDWLFGTGCQQLLTGPKNCRLRVSLHSTEEYLATASVLQQLYTWTD